MELALFIKMIKLIDILNEGTIQLTSKERDQIETLLPKVIDAIKGPSLKKTEYKLVGVINFESADKTLGSTRVFVGNDGIGGGYFQTLDPKNPTDNYIVVQQDVYKDFFGILGKGYSTLTGDEMLGEEEIRRVLRHELIHAKDPAVNQHYLKEPYDSNKPELYYKSWTEFQTMTGQFFETISSAVNRLMSKDISNEDVRKIEKSLNEILNFFAGKSKNISQDTIDFIQGNDKRNIFQRIVKFIETTSAKLGIDLGTNFLNLYIPFLNLIKQYNPE